MDLSPGDKQTIYLEEKARIEAQAQIKKEQKQEADRIKRYGCLALLGIFIIWAFIVTRKNESPSSLSEPSPAWSGAATPSRTPLPAPRSLGRASGFGANRFLATQMERNRELQDLLRAARDSGNIRPALTALRLRRTELKTVLKQIESGDHPCPTRQSCRTSSPKRPNG